MITLRDIFEVTPTVSRLEIVGRDADLKLLHKFWIGSNCDREHLPGGMLDDWTKGRLTLCDRTINVHGETGKGGYAEIGWGYKKGSVPHEILSAEIQWLSMGHVRAFDGMEVKVDIIMTPLAVEMCRTEMGGDRCLT